MLDRLNTFSQVMKLKKIEKFNVDEFLTFKSVNLLQFTIDKAQEKEIEIVKVCTPHYF